jgi:hypothetical protein
MPENLILLFLGGDKRKRGFVYKPEKCFSFVKTLIIFSGFCSVNLPYFAVLKYEVLNYL